MRKPSMVTNLSFTRVMSSALMVCSYSYLRSSYHTRITPHPKRLRRFDLPARLRQGFGGHARGRCSLVGDVDPVAVGIGYLPSAGGMSGEEALAHIGLGAAAQGYRREVRIHSTDRRDMRLEGVEVLNVKADVIGTGTLDGHPAKDFDGPGHDG